MKKICAYVRVSTNKQKEEGVSIDTQQKMIIDYALRFEFVESKDDILFFIDEGYSAKTLNRPQMNILIDLIKKKEVGVLFAYDLSRISRDLFDSNVVFGLLQKYGVVLKCLYEDVKLETAGDRFTTNIKVLNNQYERERIVERTNDGLKNIAKSGRYPNGGKVMFGYYRGSDKNIYIHSRHSKLVKEVFTMAKDGCDIDYIKYYLNHSQNDKIFTNVAITKMLQDERYCGILNYKGEIYTNIIPPLITHEDLNLAKQNYKKIKYKQDDKYYFDGLVYCHCCGSRMTCSHSYGCRKIYYYYKCNKCNKIIGQHHIEEYLYRIKHKNKEKVSREIILQKEIRSLKAKIKNNEQKYLNEQLTDKEYLCIQLPLNQSLEKVELQIEDNKQSSDYILYSRYKTNKGKRNFALVYINKIIVDVQNKEVINIIYND